MLPWSTLHHLVKLPTGLWHRLVGPVVRRPPREREIPGSNPAYTGIFSGSSHTSDSKIGTPVATLPGVWRYRVSAVTGQPGVSILWLGEVKVWSATSISVWQHVKLSEQIRPWDTLACCWDVKQPTNKQTQDYGKTTDRARDIMHKNILTHSLYTILNVCDSLSDLQTQKLVLVCTLLHKHDSYMIFRKSCTLWFSTNPSHEHILVIIQQPTLHSQACTKITLSKSRLTQQSKSSEKWLQYEGSKPEWSISSLIYSRDTPFWSGTLEYIWNFMTISQVHLWSWKMSPAPMCPTFFGTLGLNLRSV